MSIKQSPAQQIERLVAEVREGSGVRRDAAVARLRVIGEPAVDRVMALVTADAAPAAKAAAPRPQHRARLGPSSWRASG